MKEQIVRLNAIESLWLKLTNKPKYRSYKAHLRDIQTLQSLKQFGETGHYISLDEFEKRTIEVNTLNLVHSGNAGDIIYSLATVKELSSIVKKPINYLLKLGQPLDIPSYFSHPLSNVMLNKEMADSLIPLLAAQPYIGACKIYTEESVHLNLDDFRSSNLLTDRGDIGRWYGYFIGINPKLHHQWIFSEEDKSLKDVIIISRSSRYRNPSINYSFLEQYENVYFVGIAPEYDDMKNQIKNLKHLKVQNFLELAGAIASCKFFIGNQSFPFSLAEALKVPRILETYMLCPNVIPQGELAYDFYFQDHLETLVASLNKLNK